MADSIVMVDFPITFSTKFYNMFRAFVEEKIHLRMQDESDTDAIDSGGFVRLTNYTDHIPAAGDVGKTIVIIGGDYQPAVGTVTAVDPTFSITTDIVYSANATVRFFFKYDNLRMKYRFCEFSAQDSQTAANLFNDSEFIFYPDEFGELYIDISIIKHVLTPSFTADDDYNADLFQAFQVQYQTLFDTNTDTWHSAHDSGLASFEAFLSVHATGRTAQIDFWGDLLQAGLDKVLDGRMWRGYDKIFSTLTPEAETPSNIQVDIGEFNLAKGSITTQTLVVSRAVADGLLVSKLTSINANTRFIRYMFIEGVGVSPVIYDYYLTVYDTQEDDTEFYLTWVSDNGTIRQWLFTNKILFENDVSADVLTDSDYRQLPKEFEEVFTIEAKGISAIERKYISSMFVSNKIQVENDGQTVECIVSSPSWSYENRSNSYIVTIQLKLKPMAVMNV